MTFSEYLKDNIVLLDGGMGTLLAEKGCSEKLPEQYSVDAPDVTVSIHKAYYEAGSDAVLTNTFGVNTFKYSPEEAGELISAAVLNAKKAAALAGGVRFTGLDVGPLGRLLEPVGGVSFDEAYASFALVCRLGEKYGADFIFIETMTDGLETKAALLAARENTSLPVLVSNAYGSDGRMLTGGSPEGMSALAVSLGAAAVGVNCSFGPGALSPVVDRYLEASPLPVIFKPNAGLPVYKDGAAGYDITPGVFAREVADAVKRGVRIVGGCCGTTPEHISLLRKMLVGLEPKPPAARRAPAAASFSEVLHFGERPLIIGERINPTGKKKLREAIAAGDYEYILSEAVAQTERGAHILDVNTGAPGADEKETLPEAVKRVGSAVRTPLQIDSTDAAALEKALRLCPGVPLINSVNGKEESLSAVLPLVKKYGCAVIALTLDENGIPSSADGRAAIAKKIISRAGEYGIEKEYLIFDPLCLTVSTDGNAALTTLDAVGKIKSETGCLVSLGVSNVSFGLPQRDLVNSAFLTLALGRGIDFAIINPLSDRMLEAYKAYMALSGLEGGANEYLTYAKTQDPAAVTSAPGRRTLGEAVIAGLCSEAARLTKEKLAVSAPLDIIDGDIIPALDETGRRYEKGVIFLPELLAAASAAKAAFDAIKEAPAAEKGALRGSFVLASVRGDVHDIGKNIVRLLLENYGFEVTDLGRDVPPETVLGAVRELNPDFVGLSALMTTTLPAMEETVRLIKSEFPALPVFVGGAVLTEEYALSIGADVCALDAMTTVNGALQRLKDK